MERGIIKEAWDERQYLSKYQFSEYIPNLSNLKNIKDLRKKREMPHNTVAAKKVNEALNKLFMLGGEPDVL